MNVTLSIDEEVLARARALAARRGTSVNRLIREYLAELISEQSSEQIITELKKLWRSSSGNSAGKQWTRDELHERQPIHEFFQSAGGDALDLKRKRGRSRTIKL